MRPSDKSIDRGCRRFRRARMSSMRAIRLGLSNSAEEIIREKNLLIRERHYGFRVSGYIVAISHDPDYPVGMVIS